MATAARFDLAASRKAMVDVIVALLRDCPDEWDDSPSYCLQHNPSGISVWTGSGFWFVALYHPAKMKFGAIGKVRVWLALRRYMAAQRARQVDRRTRTAIADYERVHAALSRMRVGMGGR